MADRRPHPFPVPPTAAAGAGAALLALALVLPGTAGAQESPVFGERIEVRVVNIEAVVVDRDGERVRGLGPGDFRLRVDGRDEPIEFFSEVADGLAVEAAPGAAATATAPPAGIEGGQPVETSYLVFIDDYLTLLAGRRNQILEELADDLAHLGPRDRMAIVAFDGRELALLANWTGSRSRLAGAFETARARPLRGLENQALTRDLRRVVGGEPSVPPTDAATALGDPIGGVDEQGLTDERGVALDLCNRIERFERALDKAVRAATATLRSFGRPPGRKVMLVLSGGWPQSVRDYLGGFDAPVAAGRCFQRGPKLYRPLYETANLLGYTLYPVDVAAASSGAPGSGPSAEDRGPAADSLGIGRTAEMEGTLLRLAEETGGRAMLGGARLSALERVVDDTRSYYWIGFTPEWKGDDREHGIELEVLRPGLAVRSRQGYHDLSRSAEVTFMVESALLFDGIPNARPLEVELGPPGRGRRPVVPLVVTIPMDAVTMVPMGGQFVAELELRVAALDESGDQNDIEVIPVKLAGPAPPPPGSHAVYETAVKLRREAHDLVVSLYDPLSDNLLTTKTRFEP